MKLKVCPSTLKSGYSGYCVHAIKHLFGGKTVSPFLDIDLEKDMEREQIAANMNRISVSGVQEKMSAVIDNGFIRLANRDQRSTHILKPAPLDYGLKARKQIPANEHLTMQLARQVYSIDTAENGLCFDAKGRPIYITKRFDILSDGSKTPMEDFASIIGKNEAKDGPHYKYEACYEDIALAIRQIIPAWPIAIEKLFRIVIFNYIFGNGDAHLKNFSLQRIAGEVILAPAYDLMNTCLHLDGDDFGLNGGLMKSGWRSAVYDHTGHACKSDFEVFGQVIGLPTKRINTIIKEYEILPQLALQLIANSFLDAKNKRNYLRIINERLMRFRRISD